MNIQAPILCAALIAFSSAAFAKTPPSRAENSPAPSVDRNAPPAGEQRCVGTVGRVDLLWHVLRVQRYGAVLPMNLVWNSRTTFFAGSRPVTAASVSRGDLVTVWYHTPIIGRRTASQVVIARAAPVSGQQGAGRR